MHLYENKTKLTKAIQNLKTKHKKADWLVALSDANVLSEYLKLGGNVKEVASEVEPNDILIEHRKAAEEFDSNVKKQKEEAIKEEKEIKSVSLTPTALSIGVNALTKIEKPKVSKKKKK